MGHEQLCLFKETSWPAAPVNPWRVLVVDDEDDVHVMTRFVLEDYTYQTRKLEVISAYSAQEAKILLAKHHDIAVILLDVVMEGDDAGLQLVKYIRNHLQNHLVRIVLRTGQPGYAPEKWVVSQYDINDYKNKTELTDQKLFTVMTASLRSYSDMQELDWYRQYLEAKVGERTRELLNKNEELLTLNQTLQKLQGEKTNLLKIASLDLKNPLSSIQELSILIQRALEDLSKEEVINLMHVIEVSSQRMVGVIKELLQANALAVEDADLVAGIFDFRPSSRFLLDDYLELAQAKDIHLHLELQGETEYQLLVNKSATLQVLDNLISNAINDSPVGKNVFIRIGQAGHFMRCEVQDEGVGLSEEESAQIFGKSSLLTPQLGCQKSRLGLFIVRKLMEAINGRMWCETKLGRGTTLVVEFPLASRI